MEMLVISAAIILGLLPAGIAQRKGRSFFLWWLYGALLFLVAFIHSLVLAPTEKSLLDRGMKKCPFCAEILKPEAIVCRFCGRDLPANFHAVAKHRAQTLSNKETAMRFVIYLLLVCGLILVLRFL